MNNPAAKMSKSILRKQNLLSSFSRSVKADTKHLFAGAQCARLCTNAQRGRGRPVPEMGMRLGLGKAVGLEKEGGRRMFSTTGGKQYKTVQEQRSRYTSGVCLFSSFYAPHTSFFLSLIPSIPTLVIIKIEY
jgi:hypothetical protein